MLVDRVCTAVEADGSSLDWEALAGDAEAWEAAGVGAAEAREALRGAAELCTLEGAVATEEFRVRRRDQSGYLEGWWRDEMVRLTPEKTEPSALWGRYASWEATDSLPSLRGRRLLRPKGETGKTPMEVGGGDVLQFAQPDRAAFLELAHYDRMPEMYQGLSALFDTAADKAGGADDSGATDLRFMDSGATELAGDPEVREAALFAKRLELISVDAERTRERLRRLREMPLARQLASRVEADADLRELARALEPWWERLYGAARSKQVPTGDEAESVTVINLEFNLLQVVGALVVIAVLAYGASQSVKSSMQPAARDQALPMYTLRS